MKKTITFLAVLGLFAILSNTCFANNLQLSNLLLRTQDTDNNNVMVRFDISWENSWRTDNLNGDGVTNWDAAWLFVKYKKASDGNWYQATLNTTNTNHNNGSQGSSATITQTDAVGVFFHRSGNGSGTFTSTGVQLRWEYGTDGLSDDLNTDIAEIKVFGIEMVYVPEGAFYVGSGGSEANYFYTYGGNNPYQITSEGLITVGQTNGNLWASGAIASSTIPADFPKGYKAFYCMKYEITQEQYVEFLNTLTRTQQNTRTATDISGTSITNRYVMSNSASMVNRNGIRCDGTIPASPTPVTFYCDFNGNGTGNESSDGQNIACNYLNWADGCAYSDWAGLRPMTELEFEKACRGTKTPVANEYAWGNTTISQASAVSNAGAANENISSGNCNYSLDWNSLVQGPIREGIFATGETNREQSGASYYGIMELSGNVWELPVTVGNSTGRSFVGTNGNGSIDASGNANVSNWPGANGYGAGFRGTGWSNLDGRGCISDRWHAVDYYPGRYIDWGFRCVRNVE